MRDLGQAARSGKRRKVDENKQSKNAGDPGENIDDMDAVAAEERKQKYFADAPELTEAKTFTAMELSRPFLRAVTVMGFTAPSLVQQRAIPIALLGHDLCACATTGSGKTAAYMLPVLERLLFRPKQVQQTRVLVLSPTRELALQVQKMSKKLARFTDIQFGLAVGGINLRAQEAELRRRPDVVIATPGRLVDHIRNTMSFDLSAIEILILDEADRLLEVGFQDELEVIVDACPKDRQTMLFSATMTDEVEDLVSLSLHDPIRLFINKNSAVTSNLTQEFVRIRNTREDQREAIVLALCSRTFTSKCLVFVQAKLTAHRLRIIFGLAGLKAGELHGKLTQAQRIQSLDQFSNDELDFLICTDVAGRGLDIPGTEVVMNMHMPNTTKQYIHRVGRTARAGASGRSCTLVGERGRKLLRDIVKAGRGAFKNRVLPQAVIDRSAAKIKRMEPSIKEIMKQEAEETQLEYAEMEVQKMENMLTHKQEIMSRPARTWIKSAHDKKQDAAESKLVHKGEQYDLPSAKVRLKGEKLAKKEAPLPLSKIDPAGAASVRAAKRAKKPKKMTVHLPEHDEGGKGKKRKKGGSGVNFKDELTPGRPKKKTGDEPPKNRKQQKKKGPKGPKVEPKDKSMIKKAPNKKFKSAKKYKRR